MGTVPNPRDWHVDETVTSTLLNTEIRDGIDWMIDVPRIMVKRNSNYTNVDSQISTPIPWDNETFKVDFTHSNVTDSERLNVQTPGLYLVVANIEFLATNNTTGQRLVHIQINGTSTFASANMTPPHAAIHSELSVAGYQRARAGDWFQVNVYQSSLLDNQSISSASRVGAVWMER